MPSTYQELLKIGLIPTAALAAQQAEPVAQTLEKNGVLCLALKKPTPQVVATLQKYSRFLIGVYDPQRMTDLISGIQFAVGENFPADVQAFSKETGFPLITPQELPGGVVPLDDLLASNTDWQKNLSLHLKKAVQDMLGFSLRHVGINCQDEQESSSVADTFERIFGLPKEDRGGAYFAGDIIEVMKKKFYGTHGHIAIATTSAESAAYHLEKAGVKLNWKSAGYNPDGRLRVVYLQDEIGGFAVHILQK